MVKVARERDKLLTDFGKETLKDRYLLNGEDYQNLFKRVAEAYGNDEEQKQRLYDYISQLWFMPATPVLSNGGTDRGLPISCYLNSVEDSLEGIASIWNENVYLAAKGGGIGTYWGGVRSIGEKVGQNGKTSGIIPFVCVSDSLTLAISQGSLRRGSSASYIDVSHPEIEEFLDIRKPSGDFNRKALNIHHGLLITDSFMEAVRNGKSFALVSPKTRETVKEVDARSLFQKIVETRLQTGEPYLVFIDTVNRSIPEWHKRAGLKVQTSNLCSEITLPTNEDRTAVCCLSSLNLAKWHEWKDNPQFIQDIYDFLANVLKDFIKRAPEDMRKAIASAYAERSVGLGVMGFHTLLQQENIPFESVMAKVLNNRIFKHIKKEADKASKRLAIEYGPCPDAKEYGFHEYFSNKTAIAPTASISIICGGVSACVEPIPANIYTHKTLSGSFTVKNPLLTSILEERGINTEETWGSILEAGGSVQHLKGLTKHQRDVFKTSFEIDQRWVLDLAADRSPLIDQAQSINLFVEPDIDKWDLVMLHYKAWEMGIKSLYYLRSKSLQRAGFVGGVERDNTIEHPVVEVVPTEYEECISCQ